MKYCTQCRESFAGHLRHCPHDGERLVLNDPYHLVGRTLAEKYRIDEMIGAGGMGAVYSAEHLGIRRRVAFKILLPHFAHGSEHLLSLFTREAQTAGQVKHPNVVDITDAGRTPDGIAYLVMEWLEGQNLEDLLRARGRLDLVETRKLLGQIAEALDAAHRRKIIHRDLKPSNIMLISGPDEQWLVKVLDFGLAKVLDEQAASPVSAIMGTPHYASPEHYVLGGAIDHRADIYSLGIVLYQMLAGDLPFWSSQMQELIQLHRCAPPPPIRMRREEVPAGIESLILKMMAKDPDERPMSAAEVVRLYDEGTNSSLDRQTIIQYRHQTAGGNRRPQTNPVTVDIDNDFALMNTRAGQAVDDGASPVGWHGLQFSEVGAEANASALASPPDVSDAGPPARDQAANHAQPRRSGVRILGLALLGLALFIGVAAYAGRSYFVTPVAPPATTSPEPVVEADLLRLWLEVRKGGRLETERVGPDAVPRGAKFRFHFLAVERGYLYIIAPGENNVPTTWLTPQPPSGTGVGANALEAGAEFVFPHGDWFGMTKDETRMAFTVIFSRTPLTQPAFLARPALRSLTATEQLEFAELRRRIEINPIQLRVDPASGPASVVIQLGNRSAGAASDSFIFDLPIVAR